ncbi:PAS domain-containing protein [Pseudomonas fluorescens]|uniref:PAS domain-containing protein n=1 Tax=Pseudomonas fluorescens TaxID=294 RepID=UPI0002F418FF|nr:PAS domain S-box protein [Pseudomonas fluorescens]
MPQLSDDQANTTLEQMELLRALYRSIAIIEFTPDGTVLRANRNYLKIFSYKEQQIRGLHHRALCQADYANSSAFNNFWSRLQEGQSISGQYLYVSAEGRLVWLEASYNPVFAADGQLLKIIQFASDVSTLVKTERLR